jgi:hypothetical protein
MLVKALAPCLIALFLLFFRMKIRGVSLARAKMTESGKLTPRFSYLQDFLDSKIAFEF